MLTHRLNQMALLAVATNKAVNRMMEMMENERPSRVFW